LLIPDQKVLLAFSVQVNFATSQVAARGAWAYLGMKTKHSKMMFCFQLLLDERDMK